MTPKAADDNPRDDLGYQLLIFRKMIGCLPERPRVMLLEQLDKVLAALVSRDAAVKTAISARVDDAVLEVKALEFDLEATRRERDDLQRRLDGLP